MGYMKQQYIPICYAVQDTILISNRFSHWTQQEQYISESIQTINRIEHCMTYSYYRTSFLDSCIVFVLSSGKHRGTTCRERISAKHNTVKIDNSGRSYHPDVRP
jgi:hypothetical protein